MADNTLLITAARVAKLFAIDPIKVLGSPKSEWLIRIAALEVIRRDEEKAEQEREANSKSK